MKIFKLSLPHIKKALLIQKDIKMPTPPAHRRVFCPVNPETAGDSAVRQACSSILNMQGVVGPVINGNTVALGTVDPLAKLYIICHGHQDMPMFTVGSEKWTAKEMADLLESSGLKKTHREIVMLICHAGQTLGDKSVINQRISLQKSYDKVKNSTSGKDATKKAATIQKFDQLKSQASPTTFTSEDQVLPMVSQLIDALKTKKYEFIRMQAFLGPVSANLSNGIKVEIGGKYEAASESNTVNWL